MVTGNASGHSWQQMAPGPWHHCSSLPVLAILQCVCSLECLPGTCSQPTAFPSHGQSPALPMHRGGLVCHTHHNPFEDGSFPFLYGVVGSTGLKSFTGPTVLLKEHCSECPHHSSHHRARTGHATVSIPTRPACLSPTQQTESHTMLCCSQLASM